MATGILIHKVKKRLSSISISPFASRNSPISVPWNLLPFPAPKKITSSYKDSLQGLSLKNTPTKIKSIALKEKVLIWKPRVSDQPLQRVDPSSAGSRSPNPHCPSPVASSVVFFKDHLFKPWKYFIQTKGILLLKAGDWPATSPAREAWKSQRNIWPSWVISSPRTSHWVIPSNPLRKNDTPQKISLK